MKTRLLSAVAALALLVSCAGSPLDKPYNKATYEQDLKAIAESGELDSNNTAILLGVGMAGALNITQDLDGKTYREIIDAAKKKEAEKKALEEKARKEEQERVQRLSEALNVAVFEKSLTAVSRYEEYITFKFALDNKADKELRAFKGIIKFTNLFGDEIKSVNITYDQPIPAKESVNWEAYIKYNDYIDADKLLANKDLKDLKYEWMPEKIMYTDGSSLE